MPRPPILPTIDWQSVFKTGQDWADWLKRGESPENQAAMEAARTGIPLEDGVRAALEGLARDVRVVAIAEDWCGDVVRHAPVLQAMADCAPRLAVRFIHRADYPDLFARYLTNGGEAIPKFVFLSVWPDEHWVECGNWGALPYACKELIARGKACGDVAAARTIINARYEADPDRRETAKELLDLIGIATSESPEG